MRKRILAGGDSFFECTYMGREMNGKIAEFLNFEVFDFIQRGGHGFYGVFRVMA